MIRTLFSHSLVYGLTHIAARGSILVLLLVLATILAPADYGALAMLTLVGTLAAVVVPLQVAQGLARHHGAAATQEEKDRYSSSAWWFTLASQLMFLALGQLFAAPATNWILGDASYLPVFRIALFVMVLNSLFFFLQSQFRWAFRPGDFVAVTLMYSLLTLGLAIALALLWAVPLKGVVVGQSVGAAVAVAWGGWRLRDHLSAGLDRLRLKEMLRFAAPLVPAAFAVGLISYSSRIILNDVGTLADVGVFALAGQIATIATLSIVGLQAAMTPLITVHHDEPGTRAEVGRVFETFCAAGLIVCLVLGLFAAEVVSWLDEPAYARAGSLVLLLAPAVLLCEMYIFAPGFWIAKRTGLQAAVSVGAAIFAFATGYALTVAFGMEGAAIAALASGAFFFASWWIVSARFYPVPVRWARLALYLIPAGGAGAAVLIYTDPGTALAVALKLATLVFAAVLAFATGLVPWRNGVLAALSHLRRQPPHSPDPQT